CHLHSGGSIRRRPPRRVPRRHPPCLRQRDRRCTQQLRHLRQGSGPCRGRSWASAGTTHMTSTTQNRLLRKIPEGPVLRGIVEPAGIEPASIGGMSGLLRAQPVFAFLSPSSPIGTLLTGSAT